MYKSLYDAVIDLERNGHLVRIKRETDPYLEMAEIHRRVFDAGGPALFFEKVKGSPFPAVSNLYGTFERTDFLFRKTLPRVRQIMELKADPGRLLKAPLSYWRAPFTALSALPRKSFFKAPVTHRQTTINQLPQIVSWPDDGGAFITLPQVMTLPPPVAGKKDNLMQSNIGMYRIQLSGNEYTPNKEVGLHYQIHRGIGVHHAQYNRSDEPFRAAIYVGGPPSHTFAAIMPMPEGLSEMTFAGMLGGRRFRYKQVDGYYLSADADFCIVGKIVKNRKKPEGPFGDHLGYYSLQHDFPVMEVERVYHRKNAIWHFTVVGRPPQEDSSFGYLIHKLVGPVTAQEFPGLHQINAVDAAGVHPLLLAIGSERYMPFREKKPEEIITIANRILGSGQTSLAKYLFIAAIEDNPELNTHDLYPFFHHLLERIDWQRDLHFQTNTTIDTLDYSGTGWNAGSKVIVACCGEKRRELRKELPAGFSLPKGYRQPSFATPGILVVGGLPFTSQDAATSELASLTAAWQPLDWTGIPLIIVVDDAPFTTANVNNFVWVTFTRSNPSHDIYGIDSFIVHKHWGCKGPLIIDARTKPHHAPPLIPDKEVAARVDALFAGNGELREIG